MQGIITQTSKQLNYSVVINTILSDLLIYNQTNLSLQTFFEELDPGGGGYSDLVPTGVCR